MQAETVHKNFSHSTIYNKQSKIQKLWEEKNEKKNSKKRKEMKTKVKYKREIWINITYLWIKGLFSLQPHLIISFENVVILVSNFSFLGFIPCAFFIHFFFFFFVSFSLTCSCPIRFKIYDSLSPFFHFHFNIASICSLYTVNVHSTHCLEHFS